MRKSILVISFFTLIFLFSGCAENEFNLSLNDKIEIGELLDIKQPIATQKCKKIPIYKEPPVYHCSKKMNKNECLVYMARRSMEVRYQLRKQIRVCEAINRRQQNE
jgi:hypothetical protein